MHCFVLPVLLACSAAVLTGSDCFCWRLGEDEPGATVCYSARGDSEDY